MKFRNTVARNLAMIGLGIGSLAVVSGSPAAAAPTCHLYKLISYNAGHINARAGLICEDPTEDDDYPVDIQRRTAAGAWVTVASGMNGAHYRCVGTATNTYRTGPTFKDRTVTAPCG